MRGWIKTSKPECVREVNLKKLSKADLNYFEINIVLKFIFNVTSDIEEIILTSIYNLHYFLKFEFLLWSSFITVSQRSIFKLLS